MRVSAPSNWVSQHPNSSYTYTKWTDGDADGITVTYPQGPSVCTSCQDGWVAWTDSFYRPMFEDELSHRDTSV